MPRSPVDPLPPLDVKEPGLWKEVDRLAARPLRLWIAAYGLLAAIGLADYLTGDQVLLFMLYLVPVSVLAWGGGPAAGYVAGLVATAVVLVTYVALGGVGFRPIHGWHAAIVLVSTTAMAWAVARLKADHLRILGLLEAERRLARQDPLTGVASARAFHERLVLEIDRMKRHGKPLSLLYLDLDDFKRINDERGHRAGDELLGRVGRLLLSAVRRIDLCARLGGDEFAVLMPETGPADALQVAHRVRDGMLRSFRDGGASVGMSAGLGTFEGAPLDAEVPLNQVDHLMYEAKRAGKNRIVERVFP